MAGGVPFPQSGKHQSCLASHAGMGKSSRPTPISIRRAELGGVRSHGRGIRSLLTEPKLGGRIHFGTSLIPWGSKCVFSRLLVWSEDQNGPKFLCFLYLSIPHRFKNLRSRWICSCLLKVKMYICACRTGILPMCTRLQMLLRVVFYQYAVRQRRFKRHWLDFMT